MAYFHIVTYQSPFTPFSKGEILTAKIHLLLIGRNYKSPLEKGD